jgi:hypothetical protein
MHLMDMHNCTKCAIKGAALKKILQASFEVHTLLIWIMPNHYQLHFWHTHATSEILNAILQQAPIVKLADTTNR